MKFNKNRLLKLLKESKKHQEEGKSYSDYMNDELLSYLIMIEDQFFWESKKEYI